MNENDDCCYPGKSVYCETDKRLAMLGLRDSTSAPAEKCSWTGFSALLVHGIQAYMKAGAQTLSTEAALHEERSAFG